MEITLSITEQALVRYIAEQRQQNKERGGIQDKKTYNTQNPLDINIRGFGAELAVCKLLNIYPDLEIHNIRGGWDCIYKGQRVDVKFTTTDYLIAPEHKNLGACDLYILTKGKFPTYKIIGWEFESNLLKTKNLGDWFSSGHPCYVLHKDELNDTSTLKFLD